MSRLFSNLIQLPLLIEPPIDGEDSGLSTYDILGDDSITDGDDDGEGEQGDNNEEEETPKGKKEEKEQEDKDDSESDDDSDNAESDDDELDSDKAEEELKDLEEELSEEVDDDKLELMTPVRRKEILKKYPELFKDFPYLEKAYYREQQFTELLPTIEDAKTAVEKASVLDKFEADLANGDTTKMLQAMKAADENAFAKLVDDYLPNLAAVDEKAYHHVLGNVIRQTCVEMLQEAQRSQDPQLKAAAAILNKFAFGTSDIKGPTRLSRETKDDPRETQLREEQERFAKQRFETARTEINTKVNNQIKATIDTHIDPRKSMTEYVRKNVSRDALESLNGLIEKDRRFKLILDKLWENAHRSNYDRASTDKIRSAVLSKAKTLLPTVIKKARIEGLKGMGKRVREKVEDNQTNDGKPSSNTKKPATAQPKGKGAHRINVNARPEEEARKLPKNMSTLDILMSD